MLVYVDFPSPIPPIPFKEEMGEYSAAYMGVNLYTGVKQYLKVGLWGQLL